MAASTEPTKMAPEKAPPIAIPRYENNVFAEADFLYWVAKQEGNDYATTGAANTVPGTLDPNTGLTPESITHSGRVYAPHSRIKPGYRLGLGINLEHGGWDLFSEYTYLYSKASGSVSSGNLNTGLLPIFSYTPNNSILSNTTYAGGAAGFVSSAQSNWSLHFNNMNLELGRNMQLFPYLSLRPHFGLQASWQKQHFQAVYKVASISDMSDNLGNNQVLSSQDFWGLGVRAGLDSVWKCCNHLGLFANSAVSALWGQFKCQALSYDTNIAAGYDDVLIGNQINRLHTLSPVMQLEAGLQSDWEFCQKYRFLMQAGWEQQVWFFQNQHSSTIADTSLILQGLSVKFRFDF